MQVPDITAGRGGLSALHNAAQYSHAATQAGNAATASALQATKSIYDLWNTRREIGRQREQDKQASESASKESTKEASKPSAKSDIMPSNNPHEQKQIHKEQRGIYNVTYNGKNASLIRQDLDSIDSAILYEKGRENPKNHKGYGARHIFKHTKNDKELGYISQDELLNLGQNLRNYLAKHKEPFIDKNGARIYEWEKEGVRFRAVVGSTSKAGKDPATTAESKDLSLPTQRIITFYSDRNLANDKVFEFKNPKLQELPPMMRE